MKRNAQNLIEIALVAIFVAVIGYSGWSLLGGNIQSLLSPSMVTSDANTGRFVGTANINKANNDLNTLSNSKNTSLQTLVNTIKANLNSGKDTAGVETSGAMALFLAKNDITKFTPEEQSALNELQNLLPQATSDIITLTNQLAAKLGDSSLTIDTKASITSETYDKIVGAYQKASESNDTEIQGLLTQLKAKLAAGSN